MKASFSNSVAVLVKAYLNDTLAHSNCHACAVGNLVAAACEIRVIKTEGSYMGIRWDYDYPCWDNVFVTNKNSPQKIDSIEYKGVARAQIDVTGYTWQQLAKIEYAFETAPAPNGAHALDPTWMFNGLMAVVDVLAEIHGISLEEKESAKVLFVR